MMSFQNISNIELISRMEKLVRTERKITHLILQCIFEIEERKIYVEMGYDGMYSYLTRGLGYSEASAYRRLQAARLLKQVPEISEKVETGFLNLSQLTQVQKYLKEQNKRSGEIFSEQKTLQILEKIENKNSFETERILASEFDQPIQAQEKIKPQKDNSIRLEITLIEEQFSELEQAKSFLSHLCPDGSWSDIIGTLAKIYNTKKLKGSESNLSLSLCSISSIHLTHSTTYRSGSNESENLRVLCKKHNSLMAAKVGLKFNGKQYLSKSN